MAIATGTALVIGAGLAYFGSKSASKAASKSASQGNALMAENLKMQNEIMEKNLAFQKEEAAKLEKQKSIYRNMEFKNPYENVTNQFADMENMYEDLAIDTRAAEFRKQQGQQQRANILDSLKGAAGGSGIAGLAQSLANQAQLQTQQDSITIGQQERQNQMMERQAAMQIDQLERKGEGAAEMARLGGESALQEMEMSRQATLLGVQMGQTSGANQAVQQSYANQMSAAANQANMYGQQAASQYQLAGQYNQNMMNNLTNYMTL